MSAVCDRNERLTIRFEGRLDTAKCAEIEAETRQRVGDAQLPAVFDLEKVDFISSAFLRLCIHAHKQAGELGFQVVNVDPLIKRVFKIAGLDFMLGGEPSRE